MSNRIRKPDKRTSNRAIPHAAGKPGLRTQTSGGPPPGKRIWVLSALGALFLLAVAVAVFSMWMILRHH